MPKLTDDELRTLAANARANDGQVEKWLDRDRSLALIEEVQELRAALREALNGWEANAIAVQIFKGGADELPHGTQHRLAELQKLVGE